MLSLMNLIFFPFRFNNPPQNVYYPAWDYWGTIKIGIKLCYCN